MSSSTANEAGAAFGDDRQACRYGQAWRHAQARPQQDAPHRHPAGLEGDRRGEGGHAPEAARPGLGSLACCAAEALAVSARLAGATVGADDVEALYWATVGDPDEGASILATLEVASAFGLAGHRPAAYGGGNGLRLICRDDELGGHRWPLVVLGDTDDGGPGRERADAQPVAKRVLDLHPLILGLDLPGAHTVLAVGDTWWSWGRPWHRSAFPHAVIEEAWAVSWS